MAIHVDHHEIEKLGGTFHDLKTNVDDGTKGLDGLEIKAGDFPEADKLEEVVKKHADEAAECAKNISAACGHIGDGLKECSKAYDGVEHGNAKAVKDLDNMVHNVEDELPGVNDDDNGKGHH